MSDWHEGDAIGVGQEQYQLLSRLGAGADGESWLAVYVNFRQKVVLKRCHLDLIDPESSQDQEFFDEGAAVAELDHPAIARCYRGFERDGFLIISREFVDGAPLDEAVCEWTVGLEGRLDVFEQIVDAIAHAHHRGVCHGDLKPGNVLVKNDRGTLAVKIIDFSPTRFRYRLSSAIDFGATPGFEVPEVIRKATKQSDVWGLGLLLIDLVAGAAARRRVGRKRNAEVHPADLVLDGLWSEDGQETASLGYSHGDLATLRRMMDDREVRALLARGLSLDPAERWSDAGSFAKAFRACRRGDRFDARLDREMRALAVVIPTEATSIAFSPSSHAFLVGGEELLLVAPVGKNFDQSLWSTKEFESNDPGATSKARFGASHWRSRDRLAAEVTAVAASPRELAYAIGCSDGWSRSTREGFVELWQWTHAPRGVPGPDHAPWVVTLDRHEDRISDLAFSADGLLLASASHDKTVKVWDLSTLNLTAQLEHDEPVERVMFSRECSAWGDHSAILLSVSRAGTSVWSARTGQLLAIVGSGENTNDEIVGVALNRKDGRTLAVARSGDGIRLLDILARQPIREPWRHLRRVSALEFSPSGRVLAVAGETSIQLLDAGTWRRLVELPVTGGVVARLTFSDDGRWLASCDKRSGRLWDVAGFKPSEPAHNEAVQALSWLPNPRRGMNLLASVSGTPIDQHLHRRRLISRIRDAAPSFTNGSTHLWRWKMGRGWTHDERSGSLQGGCRDVAISPRGSDGRVVCRTAGDDGWIRVVPRGNDDQHYDLRHAQVGSETVTLIRGKGWRGSPVNAVVFAAGRIVSAAGDSIVVRESSGGPAIATLGHASGVTTVCVMEYPRRKCECSARGGRSIELVSGTQAGTLHRWCLCGRPIGEPLDAHDGPVRGVCFDSESLLLCAIAGRSLRLWDAVSGNLLAETRLSSRPLSVAWIGALIAVGDETGHISLLDRTLSTLHAWSAHTDGVTAIASSPCGSMLASGSSDGDVKIWPPGLRLAPSQGE